MNLYYNQIIKTSYDKFHKKNPQIAQGDTEGCKYITMFYQLFIKYRPNIVIFWEI